MLLWLLRNQGDIGQRRAECDSSVFVDVLDENMEAKSTCQPETNDDVINFPNQGSKSSRIIREHDEEAIVKTKVGILFPTNRNDMCANSHIKCTFSSSLQAPTTISLILQGMPLPTTAAARGIISRIDNSPHPRVFEQSQVLMSLPEQGFTSVSSPLVTSAVQAQLASERLLGKDISTNESPSKRNLEGLVHKSDHTWSDFLTSTKRLLRYLEGCMQ